MTTSFKITEDHKSWSKRKSRQYRKPVDFWINLISEQKEKCALTQAPLLFDIENGTPKKDNGGCHPLYAAVDHIKPGSDALGYQILCYDINDLKAHLPPSLFDALRATSEWKQFAKKWEKLSKSPSNRNPFKNLIKNGIKK